MNKILTAVLVAGLLAGCASNKPAGQGALADANADSKTSANNGATTGGASADQLAADALAKKQAEEAAKAASAAAAGRSVFFPFDVDALQDKDKAVVQANGEYLAAHNTVKARVEGNADERGSSEYNLALGQRRAENTKRGLVASGATAAQIETVSFGEEKPADAGHNEAAWAKNRRADIVIK
jgi:peptidoglycan-associated lipoprotein